MTTPAAIKAWRARLSLTQEDAARLLPCSVRTLQDWEQGRQSPPSVLARAMADVERELTARVYR